MTPTPEERARFRDPTPRGMLVASLCTWLLLATVHRLALLGRYQPSVFVAGKFAKSSAGHGRFLGLALLDGFASDLASYLFLAGPFVALAMILWRFRRAPAALLLPWIPIGAMALALLMNVLTFRHTGMPLDFRTLAVFGELSSAIDFIRREAGGWLPLVAALGSAFLIPLLLGFALRRVLPEPGNRALGLGGVLAAVLLLYVFRAAFGAAVDPSARLQVSMVHLYEDPSWRLFTGALWVRFSATAVRELTPRELAELRPALIPWDASPPLDPAYPVFRKFAPSGPRTPDVEAPATPRNLVLVMLESNSTSDIGAFGDPGGSTPRFDALAAAGTLFTRFYSSASDSEGALFATLGSIYPPSASRAGLDVGRGSLTDVLMRRGYAAGFLMTHDSSWTIVTHIVKGMELMPMRQGASSWGDDKEIFARAEAWLEHAPKPAFVVVFTATHHSPWVLPAGGGVPGADEWTRSRETLRYQDEALGNFIEVLDRKPEAERPLVVMLGDHGSHLTRGGTTQFAGLNENAFHVPLLLYRPGWIPAGRSDVLGSEVDVAPTIADLLRFDDSEVSFLGRSLLRGGQGRVAASSIFAEGLLGLMQGDLKTVYSPYLGTATAFRLGTDEPLPDIDPRRLDPLIAQSLAIHRYSIWLQKGHHLAPPASEPAGP